MILIIIHRSKPPDVRIEHIDDFRPSAPRGSSRDGLQGLGTGTNQQQGPKHPKKIYPKYHPNMSKHVQNHDALPAS